jgi:hypothetical protein
LRPRLRQLEAQREQLWREKEADGPIVARPDVNPELFLGLKLIVDHMDVPRASKGEAAYRLQPELLALAKYPNVAVKATGRAV